MQVSVIGAGLGLGLILACTSNERVRLVPPPISDAAAGTGGVDASREPNGSDNGLGAKPDASAVQRDPAVADALTDADTSTVIRLDASSITFFNLPINSTRLGVAGFDAGAGVCASIIWDYSNNDLEVERHCDDFLSYDRFPYVLVLPEQEAPCGQRWDYDGLVPTSASGCIDPVERRVDAQVVVEVQGVQYVILATN